MKTPGTQDTWGPTPSSGEVTALLPGPQFPHLEDEGAGLEFLQTKRQCAITA